MHRPTALRRRSIALLGGVALSLAAACSSGSSAGSGVAAATVGPTAANGVESATTAPGATTPGSGAAANGGKTATSAPTAATALPASAVTAPGSATATPVLAQVRLQLHQLGRFNEPVGVAIRPADPHPGRIYVVQRGGLLSAVDADGTMAGQIADLQARTAPGGERGLLGAAFSPDGTKLYVNYTDLNGDTNVDELTMKPDGTADAASRRRLLFIKQPFANHNGGHLAFGPDKMLYVGMGDGGAGGDPNGNGQNLATLLGKMLRIDPTPDAAKAAEQPYTVPADNPFVGKAGARPEIWAYGLRNPWGFSFDPATGDLWIGDVGQDKVEEVDLAAAAAGGGKGVNYGWGVFEGTSRYDPTAAAEGAVAPIYQYDHGSGVTEGCSITGGVVYRQNRIANLTGAYLFADYCVAGIRAIPAGSAEGARTEKLLIDQPANVSGFGLDGNGEVLVTTLDGVLYRLEAQK